LSQIPERANYSMASLADPDGFAGIDGIFRFGSDNVVERGLAVLEVTEDGVRVVEAAPQTFVGIGF
ncbi:MAG: penicillin-binding protein activator, partial [Rhodospirillaceae bacterium]|nr:penicillin-binding protein activator [Rhodospirillaceae bacterium]